MVRAAYDPAVAVDLARDPQLAPDWPQAGPVATREGWDSYRHDSAFSRTWCMVEAPRGVVYSRLFARLTDPDPQLLRKRVTMVYRPYSPATQPGWWRPTNATPGSWPARSIGPAPET
ncbi:hypothetical protein GCM10029963_78240 [Micromonospora andamanensis]